MQHVDPNQYLQNAELIHSEEAVNQAIVSIASQLNLDYVNDAPMVLCVMNGGVFFTGQLLSKLTFTLQFDYVHATRYGSDAVSQEIEWIVKPNNCVNARKVLILDDILDEGITLKAIVELCYTLGAAEVKVAVLTEKILNKSKPIQAQYVGLLVPNRYVFGCGMDVYGWWRNLPAIYALPNK